MKTVFVVWQDPEVRQWFPVGRLDYADKTYTFRYTKGAERSDHFMPFGRMKDLRKVYKSSEIFPVFGNRILPKSRPEYSSYVNWLAITEENDTPLEQLARTGGIKRTDSLTIYPCPAMSSDGHYEIHFFTNGLSHFRNEEVKRTEQLKVGDKLFLMFDVQNQHDRNAVAVRTDDPVTIVGYTPRYIAEDVAKLIAFNNEETSLTVERVNMDAPLQMRLLCKLRAPWPRGFSPCSQSEFEPLESYAETTQ